jgi:hypothetical protein
MRKTKKPATPAPEPPLPNPSDFREKLSHLLKEEAEHAIIALRHEDERRGAEKALAEAKTQMKQARNTLFSNLLQKNPDLVDLLAPQHTPRCQGSDKDPEWDSSCIRCALLVGQVHDIQIQLKWEEV